MQYCGYVVPSADRNVSSLECREPALVGLGATVNAANGSNVSAAGALPGVSVGIPADIDRPNVRPGRRRGRWGPPQTGSLARPDFRQPRQRQGSSVTRPNAERLATDSIGSSAESTLSAPGVRAPFRQHALNPRLGAYEAGTTGTIRKVSRRRRPASASGKLQPGADRKRLDNERQSAAGGTRRVADSGAIVVRQRAAP